MDDASLDDLERNEPPLRRVGRDRRLPARLDQRELPSLRQAQLRLRTTGSPRPRAAYLWTRTVAGRGTKGRQLSAEEVDKVRAELANYHRFAEVSDQIVAVNEEICEARPPNTAATAPPAATGDEKGGSASRSPRSSRPR